MFFLPLYLSQKQKETHIHPLYWHAVTAIFSRGERTTTLTKNAFLRKMLFHPVTLQAGSEERILVQLVEVLHRLSFSANNKLRKQQAEVLSTEVEPMTS